MYTSLGGRLRVPGGAAVRIRIVVALVVFLIAGFVLADEPVMTSHVHPYCNLNDYTTALVIINPTAEPVDVPRPCRVGPCIVDRLAPYSVTRTESWMGEGTDYAEVTLDARIRSYVSLRTPLGTIAHLPTLALYTDTIRFYDLPSASDEFEGYLWVTVPAGQEHTYITVHDDATQMLRSQELGRGGAVIAVAGPTVRVYLGAAPGWPVLPAPSGLYAFAFTTHKASGAITAHFAE